MIAGPRPYSYGLAGDWPSKSRLIMIAGPMGDFLSLIARHGYIIIFLTIFVEAIGLPVPAALALVAGGAAAASGTLRAPTVLLLAVVGNAPG